MTAVLGISAFYHDSAAALVLDGQIAAAAQEERFSRVKHDFSFPRQAIQFCLRQAGLQPRQLDYVAFYEKPWLKLERFLETHLAFAPRGFGVFANTLPLWVSDRIHLAKKVEECLEGAARPPIVCLEHHLSHAASAFFASPFEQAAVLTWDAVGEWATASYGIGQGNRIQLLRQMRFPHSLGLLYSAFTYFCGFSVNDGEYKLMGLAPYGEPVYVDAILRELVDLKADGSFWLNLSYFNFCHGRTMTSARFARLFQGPPRDPAQPLTQREMNLACSIQRVTEEIMLRGAREARRQTGLAKLCLAGGVAHNCVANRALLRDGPFEELWIQPAAGDAGGALGAALYCWYQLLDHQRPGAEHDRQEGSLLGPAYAEGEIEEALRRAGVEYRHFDDDRGLCERVAELLAQGKLVGWFQGRMEFGARALGNRSILADPRELRLRDRLNQIVKRRESFRPFAPSVLLERVDEYFDLGSARESPYMLLTASLRPSQRLGLSERETGASGLEKFQTPRSTIAAVTHVDDSARVQTLARRQNPRYHALLERFSQRTGTPLLLNTSFNSSDEPIVCSPADAVGCFLGTGLDALVLERFLVERGDNPPPAPPPPASPPPRQRRPHRGKHEPWAWAVKLDWNPSARQLRRVALLAGGVVFLCWLVLSPTSGGAASLLPLGLAALLAGVGLLAPAGLRPVYRAWALLLYPLRCVVFFSLLAGLYFLLLTPLGLVLRALGHDPLRLRAGNALSCWEAASREAAADPAAGVGHQRMRNSILQEFLLFLIDNKKWWLLPIVAALFLLGLIALASSSALPPFIYPF